MLKDVVRPKAEHDITVLFQREASQPAEPRQKAAKLAKGMSEKLRVKEYTLKLKRDKGALGFTLDPTNVILSVAHQSHAAELLKPGDKVVSVDGHVLEATRFAEVADATKPAHLLKVVRIKPKRGKGGLTAAVVGGSASRPELAGAKRGQANRIRFREVTLRKMSADDKIGVLFHRHEKDFDMRAFGKFDDGSRPIIKKVDPGTVGERAGLVAGDVVLAVNGISGQTNYQVVEMIRTLHGEITFLVAPAPKQRA